MSAIYKGDCHYCHYHHALPWKIGRFVRSPSQHLIIKSTTEGGASGGIAPLSGRLPFINLSPIMAPELTSANNKTNQKH